MQQPEQLTTSKIQSMIEGFYWVLPNVGIGLIVLICFWFGGWAAGRAVAFGFNRRHRGDLGMLLGNFVRWGLVLAGALIFATVVFPSVKPSDLLSVLGVGSVAVGLAFRDILQNWFSGLLILYGQPFRIGDQIVSGQWEGTVERVEARATLLKTYDGQRVLVPNSNLYTRGITVRTYYPVRRSELDIGISHGDDVEHAVSVLLAAARCVEGVKADPAPDCMPWAFGDSTVVIRLRWWTDSRRNAVVAAQGKVTGAVRAAMREASIDLTFPTRTLLLHDQTEEADEARDSQREGWPVRPARPSAGAAP
jgi:small conductance mechanosensitive channel